MPIADLSHPLGPETWTYPGDPAVEVEPHASIDADGYRVAGLSLGTHAGTHVDAPSHTETTGATVDELPLDRFAFEAAHARLAGDVGDGESIGPDQLPDVADAVDLLVVETGWAAHWGTDRYTEHPYLSPASARWCADRGLSVAVDAPSVDPSGGDSGSGHAVDLPAHHALLGSDRFVVENLTGLSTLPTRFELRAYPLPVVGGDGSPVRAVAVY